MKVLKKEIVKFCKTYKELSKKRDYKISTMQVNHSIGLEELDIEQISPAVFAQSFVHLIQLKH